MAIRSLAVKRKQNANAQLCVCVLLYAALFLRSKGELQYRQRIFSIFDSFLKNGEDDNAVQLSF